VPVWAAHISNYNLTSVMQGGGHPRSNADEVVHALKAKSFGVGVGVGVGGVVKNSGTGTLGGGQHHLLTCVCTLSSLESASRCLNKMALESVPGEEDDSSYISVLSSDGREFMFTKRDKNRLSRNNDESCAVIYKEEHLLSISVPELRNRLNEAETKNLVKKGLEERNDGDGNKPFRVSAKSSIEHSRGNFSSAAVGDLWVRKYAPKFFSELLSEERLNRNVLRCMKSWDKSVFGKMSIRDMSVEERGGKSFDNFESESGGGNKGAKKGASASAKLNSIKSDERPSQKVILLCGSQGLGKTTLANVAAEHCGYRPLIIGAGDDRTPEALKDVFSRAMLGNSLSLENKPNCIILDEIDSIESKASIDTLINIINQPLRGCQPGRSEGGNTYPSLSRPLICICNDQFSPSLRELRQHCAIYTLRSVESRRLAGRLKKICTDEDITISSSSLSTFANSSRGDIRSAINSLQFALSKLCSLSNETVGMSRNATTANEGQYHVALDESVTSDSIKDQHGGVFDIWSKVYRQDDQTRNSSIPAADSGRFKGYPVGAIMQHFERTSDHCDTSLMLSGLFENLPNIPYMDPTFARTDNALEWLSYGDNMLFRAQTYVPVVASALHIYCACGNANQVKLDWPSKYLPCFVILVCGICQRYLLFICFISIFMTSLTIFLYYDFDINNRVVFKKKEGSTHTSSLRTKMSYGVYEQVIMVVICYNTHYLFDKFLLI
jgi:DNA polymerase III delta prime subunit